MKEIVAGVDIGGTNTVIGFVDAEGVIHAGENLSTPDYALADDFVIALDAKLKEMMAENSGLKLIGIGIGAPNANFNKGTIELAPNLRWKGIIPLVRMTEEATGLRTRITNDANAAALGEMIFGAAKGVKDFIILTLGTGLGSGFVVDGEVVYGHTGFAGELGHMIVVEGGRVCGCGRRGCLETYASATGLVRTALSLLSDRRDDSTLRELRGSEITSRRIAEAAAAGDLIAQKALDQTARMIALGIANSVIFSSPEVIYLFGGLANAGEALFGPVRKYADELVQPVFRGTFRVEPSGLPEVQAAVLGASALIWKEMK
ncbi:MAG TPA: ROK family protein [Bacteroidales bacterium]|nr:ROK family protein [Bacteroidales bacterium]HOH14097.1 ROK family protein [Bacteroidales bacterium]HPO40731.1 ROK family protein [Bacteroidales bacterium]HQL46521.1 ROK family protein [Bacteroidales bacterium]